MHISSFWLLAKFCQQTQVLGKDHAQNQHVQSCMNISLIFTGPEKILQQYTNQFPNQRFYICKNVYLKLHLTYTSYEKLNGESEGTDLTIDTTEHGLVKLPDAHTKLDSLPSHTRL